MKAFLGFLTIAFFSVSGLANVTLANKYLLNHGNVVKPQLGTLMDQTANMLVAKYSYSVQGGASTGDINLLTDLTNPKSYAQLPANAVIKNVWFDILTQPTSASNLGKISVGSRAQSDLLGATVVSQLYATRAQGIPTGSTVTYIKTSQVTTIKANVTVQPLTAGKFNVYIDYVLSD